MMPMRTVVPRDLAKSINDGSLEKALTESHYTVNNLRGQPPVTTLIFDNFWQMQTRRGTQRQFVNAHISKAFYSPTQ